MDSENSAAWTVSRLSGGHQQQFNQLSSTCFRSNKQFWSHPSTYLWSKNEDQAFILGCFQGSELMAYLELEIFQTAAEFESRLIGMQYGQNTPLFQFPILYFSKSATDPRFQRRGLNNRMRKIAFGLARSVGCGQGVSSVIEDSEIMNAMKSFGAECHENPKKWNNRMFKSEKRPFLVSLDIDKQKIDPDSGREISNFKNEFGAWFHSRQKNKVEIGFEYTKKNHFVFGFKGIPYSLETSLHDHFFVRYGDCDRLTYDFRTECTLAAHEICNRQRGKPIYLCFSGGIDSEVMIETFRYARIPFRIIIGRYNQDLNEHDYSWAVSYCEKKQIPYEFFDFNFLEFVESAEYQKLIRQVQCRYPMLTAIMKLMEYVVQIKQGVPVLGSAECWVNKVHSGWYLVEPEPIQALYRFLIYNQLDGIPGFFQWSPELMNSYILDPSVQALIQNRISGPKSTADIKHEIYAHYFQIDKRPKFRGYEKFPELMKSKMEEAQQIFGTPVKSDRIEIRQLLDRWNAPSPLKKKVG